MKLAVSEPSSDTLNPLMMQQLVFNNLGRKAALMGSG
jgi:hypothetical protein